MRGEIWTFGANGDDEVPLLVVQADALTAGAPTIVGVVVSTRPQPAGAPLAIPLDLGAAGPAFAKVTQVHTRPARDARRRVASVGRPAMRAVDEALAVVLGLGRLSDAGSST